MVVMIPPIPREGANGSEKKVFTALEGMQDRDDWVVIHSLQVTRHHAAFVGEADFVVLAPGKGIAIIEAKSPSSARYENGDWFLENVPNPTKDPLQQLDGVRRSLRGYLKELGLLTGNEPIARLVWFTSLSRHQSENASRGDMQLFEWELGWNDDLSKPTWLLDHLFEEYDAWYSKVDGVEHDPQAFTSERVEETKHALLGNFHVSESVSDRMRERQVAEATVLAEQEVILELVERNTHVYLDGPAGTGKSHLIVQAARRNNRAGLRTLVTCWNLLMAGEFEAQVGELPNVDALSLNGLMLGAAGLDANPDRAEHTWYTETLPRRALDGLKCRPASTKYDAILIDEFQDIAGYPVMLEIFEALSAKASLQKTSLLIAGDARQQIMVRFEDQTI